jgi:lipopolysaccharide transport system ATP-binding protein
MMNKTSEVLIRAENVGKVFCRDLKKSLLYGVGDILSEILPSSGKRVSDKDTRELRPGEFWANHGISFEVRRGECLGLIGQNGAGKTTLLKMLNGLIKPDAGNIEIHGRLGVIIALGAGFNPILTGRENIYVNGAILGLSKKEIDSRLQGIIDFSGVGDFIDSPVQSYSSGMQVRLGFAIATAMEPDVLILDEVLAVGDASFRIKCIKRIGEMSKKCAVILVSHDLSQISRCCDRALLLQQGGVSFLGNTEEALSIYNEMQGNEGDVAPSQLLHPSVSRFRIITPNEGICVTAGSPLRLTIELSVTEPLIPGISLIGFIDQRGLPVAQVDLHRYLPRLLPGLNRIEVDLERVDLAQGNYSINVNFWADNWHTVLVSSLSCASLKVSGEKFLWCAYRMPVREVTIRTNQES